MQLYFELRERGVGAELGPFSRVLGAGLGFLGIFSDIRGWGYPGPVLADARSRGGILADVRGWGQIWAYSRRWGWNIGGYSRLGADLGPFSRVLGAGLGFFGIFSDICGWG